MTDAHSYKDLLAELCEDPNVTGVLLAGSRAKGMEHDGSDTDAYIIFENNTKANYIEKFKKETNKNYASLLVDLSNRSIQTLKEFEAFAEFGSEYGWDRYNIIRSKIEIDKTKGKLRKILEQKKKLSASEREMVLHQHFGDYLTHSYRLVRGTMDNHKVGTMLDSADVISHLLWTYFALHDRVRPYNKYLEWELDNFPIKGMKWSGKTFVKMMVKIARQSDVQATKEIYKEIARLAKKQSSDHFIKAWGGKLETML